ncbi:MAG: hypothetical protein K6G15_08685 [Desulfovibrio sp.]|nr:hypothetical protein [Desulfovibrio sp.]
MSLTEILLSVVIMIAVVCGVAVNYTTVREKNQEQLTLQSLEILHANIEQIYGNGPYTGISNETLIKAGAVPRDLVSGTSDIKTHWGGVSVGAGEGNYTLTLFSLPPSACRNVSNLATSSWNSVSVGDLKIYSRSENTQVTPSAVLAACNGASNVVVFTGP